MQAANRTRELLVLGATAAARGLATILGVPDAGRNDQDNGWAWPKRGYADSLTLVPMATGNSMDRIIRHHAEARLCPKANRIGVVIVGVDPTTRQALLARDVFGRRGETNDRFADWSDVTKVLDLNQSLSEILSAIAIVKSLPVSTWKRESESASCIPALLQALHTRDREALDALAPLAKAVFWDAHCSHATANAIARWLNTASPDAEPDWAGGLELFSPLGNR